MPDLTCRSCHAAVRTLDDRAGRWTVSVSGDGITWTLWDGEQYTRHADAIHAAVMAMRQHRAHHHEEEHA